MLFVGHGKSNQTILYPVGPKQLLAQIKFPAGLSRGRNAVDNGEVSMRSIRGKKKLISTVPVSFSAVQ